MSPTPSPPPSAAPDREAVRPAPERDTPTPDRRISPVAPSRSAERMRLRHWRRRAQDRVLDIDDVTVVDRPQLRKAVTASTLGNMMEWFDFGVYAYVAVYIGQAFFPSGSPTAQTIASFAAFAVAFIVRPIGGFVFGPLGDRIGRKRVLSITIVMMAAATLAIGLLPTYGAVGMAAPVLLLVCRLVQGFSTGGEYAGATTFIAESAPDRRRGFMGAWLDVGTFVGYSLGASLVTVLTLTLGHDAMADWGWRIPFLVAAPLGLIGLYLRTHMEETPAFQAVLDEAEDAKAAAADAGAADAAGAERPTRWARFKDSAARSRRPFLICCGLVASYSVTIYLLSSYMPSYLTGTLGQPETQSQLVVLAGMLLVAATLPFSGRLSDRIGRRPVIAAGTLLLMLAAVPMFLLIDRGGLLGPLLGTLALALLLVLQAGSMAATLPALFSTEGRYGGLSVAYNIAVSLFGGTTPLIVSSLEGATGNHLMAAYVLIGAGVVGLVSVYFLKETAGRPLRGSGPMVETEEEAAQLVRRSRLRANRWARRQWERERAS